jgi:predicted outer membrane repeat protein
MKSQLQALIVGIGFVLFVAAGWVGLTAVTAAPMADFVGLNGAACAYATIAEAIAAATDGDTIHLSPKTYNETLGTLDKELHFTAATADCTTATPEAHHDNYIIDGGGAAAFEGGLVHIAPGRTVTFTAIRLAKAQAVRGGIVYVAEGATAVFNRVEVRDGFANDSGGLIYVATDASLLIQNPLFPNEWGSTLRAGAAGNAGGGLYLEGYADLFDTRLFSSKAPLGGGVAIVGDGHLVLRQDSRVGGILPKNSANAGGGIHMAGQARLELLQNSIIDRNEALVSHGGGIYADGDVTIELYDNSSIFGNQANLLGGGIYAANGASLALHDQSWVGSSNPANYNGAMHGGGIYARAAQQVTLAGATVQGNQATGWGGGILLAGGSPLHITGGLIRGNQAGIWGGGLAVIEGRAYLTDVQISANQAQEHGGGIYQHNDINNRLVITNSQIISNTGVQFGGGIGSLVPVIWNDTNGSSRLAGNHAGADGGGVYYTGTGALQLIAQSTNSQIVIEGNSANGNGGGIYNHNGSLNMVGNVWLQHNVAVGDGGGVYKSDGAVGVFALGLGRSPLIRHNEALNGRGGGFYFNNVPNAMLYGATISENRADSDGGGLFASNNSAVTTINSRFHQNQADDGGGLYLSNSNAHITTHPSCANATLPANHYCSELRGNVSAGGGGAIGMELASELIVEYTAVISNASGLGGGIYSTGLAHIEITNSLLAHNVGKALHVANNASLDLVQNTFTANDWAVHVTSAGAMVAQANNIFWSNGTGVQSAAVVPAGCSISQDGVWGTADDPLFQTTLRGDYRLGSGSPAIDACAVGAEVDLDGIPRPQGANYDMGAFESGRPLFLFPAALAVPEGNAGLTPAPFTIFLSEPSAEVVSVTVTAVANTALEAVDFAPLNETVTFPAGAISQTVMLQIIGDLIYEGDEQFELHLSDGQGAELTAVLATITITDDDPQPTLTVADTSAVEGDEESTPMLFAVTLSHPSAFTVTVEFATGGIGDTAAPDVDYQASSGAVTIPAGQTTAVITIRIYGDKEQEDNEQFTLRLFNPQGAFLATPSATGTIVDDDGPQQIYLPIIMR